MSEWKLLVIEDDPDGQEVVGRILKYHRIPFVMTGNATEAAEALQTHAVNGAIIDLNLPGMDGWSLLQQIHDDPQTAALPCVAITAYHSADVAVKAIEAGFAAYFPKPLDSSSFVNDLTRVLG
jgi:CheY-like chemotaxis protein